MPLVYTKVTKQIRRNVFVVTFYFEHGDADKRTTDTMDVHLSKEEMVHYLDKVEEISRLIDDARSSGESLSDDFKETAKYNTTWILVETDCFARQTMSNYYAAMGIESIAYFDENGDEFAVKKTG